MQGKTKLNIGYEDIIIGSGAGGLTATPPGIETPGYGTKPPSAAKPAKQASYE